LTHEPSQKIADQQILCKVSLYVYGKNPMY